MLSRLKGIETTNPHQPVGSFFNFGYGFPFEGNWNSVRWRYIIRCNLFLWICFPVWRELKPEICAIVDNEVILWIWFPVWRELKHFVHPPVGRELREALDMLSRLKGIETWVHGPVSSLSAMSLDMVSRLKGIETLLRLFCILILHWCFGYAFPFEGNWNSAPPFWFSALALLALDMLSRLKGIETLVIKGLFIFLFINTLDMLSRLKGIETAHTHWHGSTT